MYILGKKRNDTAQCYFTRVISSRRYISNYIDKIGLKFGTLIECGQEISCVAKIRAFFKVIFTLQTDLQTLYNLSRIIQFVDHFYHSIENKLSF